MFKYTPHFLPSAIYLVGCGGTGSRLVPMMCQLVKTMIREHNPRAWLDELPIFLIDDDIVEEKNLVRQNFIAQDVNKSKAVVLAERYSRAFGIEIHPIVKRVGQDSIINEEVPSYNKRLPVQNIILIMAVDSPQARRSVLSAFLVRDQQSFIIDAGNEDNFGQVKFFTNTSLTYSCPVDLNTGRVKSKIRLSDFATEIAKQSPKMVPEAMPVNFIPYSRKYYENLGTTAAERSCADLDQTLAINAMMATIMCGVLQNFLYIKPFTYNQINYSLSGAVSTVFNDARFWFSEENVNENGEYRSNRVDVTLPSDSKVYIEGVKRANNFSFEYFKHVQTSLNKMNLSLDWDTGNVVPIKKEEPAKSPKKRTKITKDPLLWPTEIEIPLG